MDISYKAVAFLPCFYIGDGVWAVKVILLMRRPGGFQSLSYSLWSGLIREQHAENGRSLWDSEGCATEAELISLQLNEGIMSLNLAAITVYHVASLTLWSQGQLCINPQTVAWVTRPRCSSSSRHCGRARGIMGATCQESQYSLMCIHHLSWWIDWSQVEEKGT